METKKRAIEFYRNNRGREPAREWLDSLRDFAGKVRINTRLERARDGNFGDYKNLGEGVSELRINTGPGYRIYFSIIEDDTILLLLMGGEKSSQQNDIDHAKQNWKDHKNAKGN